MHNPQPNEIYKHFKGNLYKIITMAFHSETGEEMVVYQALYGDYGVYVRPLSLFLSPVDKVKYPDAGQENRFELLQQIIGQENTADAAAEEKQSTEEKETTEEKHTIVDAASAADTDAVTDERQSVEQIRQIDPLVMEFLESDTYETKLNILAALRPRITNDMINTMAVAVDVEINEGEAQERLEQLKACLLTFNKYECSRVR